MNKPFELLDTVIATASLPDKQVLAGDIGTVVEIYSDPGPAYEVEFVNPDGSTRALLTLEPTEIRKLDSSVIITTRPLSTTA